MRDGTTKKGKFTQTIKSQLDQTIVIPVSPRSLKNILHFENIIINYIFVESQHYKIEFHY
jgi:hypothetical protein